MTRLTIPLAIEKLEEAIGDELIELYSKEKQLQDEFQRDYPPELNPVDLFNRFEMYFILIWGKK